MAYLIDQFGDFSLYDIPALLISLIFAILISFLLSFSIPFAERKSVQYISLLLSALSCFAVSLGSGSLPAAMLASAALLLGMPLLKDMGNSNKQRALLYSALVVGAACGLKASIPALLVSAILFILLRVLPSKEQ